MSTFRIWIGDDESSAADSVLMYRGNPKRFNVGRLHVGNVDNRIRCIHAGDGSGIWNYYNPRDRGSSPCVPVGAPYWLGWTSNVSIR